MVNRVFKLVIITSLTGILYFLQFSNRLPLLINPRFMILIIFSQLFLALFLVLKIEFKSESSKFNKSYILFIIMNILLLLPSYEKYQENITRNRSVNFTSNISDVKSYDIKENESKGSTPASILDREAEELPVPEEIYLESQDYIDTVMDLYMRSNLYDGKQIFTKGFLYYDDQVNEEYSVIARLVMICCAADASVYGLLIDGRESYTKNQWYDIEGTITYEEISIDGKVSKHPVIVVENASECEAPEDPYVY